MIFLYKTKTVKNFHDLEEEVIAAIPKVLEAVGVDDQIRFRLSDTLVAAEHQLLDQTLEAFVDTDPEDKTPKIYDYAAYEARGKHFHNINYKTETTTRLVKVMHDTHGEIDRVEYYSGLDAEGVPTDLVLLVEISYNRDSSGMATSRQVTRNWINRDGTYNAEKKITSKPYLNAIEQINEGIRRRGNIVKGLQIPVMQMAAQILMPKGYTVTSVMLRCRDFLDKYRVELDDFTRNSSTISDPADENYGRKRVIVAIEGEDSPTNTEWLDAAPAAMGGEVTIRQFVLEQFDI